jgi:hypothetical protein
MSKGVIFTGVAHGALDHLELASHGLRPDSLLDCSWFKSHASINRRA